MPWEASRQGYNCVLENPVMTLKVCRNWHGYYYKYIQDRIIGVHTIFSLLYRMLTSFLN